MQKIFFIVLSIFIVFIACPVYAENDEGRSYYDFGVFAYEDGDYKSAEDYFTTAVEFNPKNALYQYHLGKTYLKTERYDKAEQHLSQAWASDKNIPGLKYDLAYLRYKTEKYADAARFFMQTAQEDSTNVLANYYAGLSLMKLDPPLYKDAAGYFVAAARKSPTIGGNGYYYAGLCYQKAGDLNAAVEMFEKVKQDPQSQNLKENADKWIEAIKKKQKALQPYSLYLKAGRRYDSNVRLEPLDIDIYPNESDWVNLLYFSGKYDLLKQESFTLGVGYSHYQSWHDDLSEYNLTGSIFNLYTTWYIAPFMIGFSYQPAYYWLDTESYLRQHRFKPEITWQADERLALRCSYTYDDNSYFDDDNRTGHAQEIATDVYYKIFNGKGYLFAGLAYEDYSARGDQSYAEAKARAGISLDTIWEINASLIGKYSARRYDEPDNVYHVEREDDKYNAGLALSRKLYQDWLSILVELSYTKNKSNINDYEYDKLMTTLSLTLSY